METTPSSSSGDYDSSSAFSECNSDISGEFPASRRLILSCAADNSDEMIHELVRSLGSMSIDEKKQAALELRLLAKNKPENRLKIGRAGAIKPLISLISSPDLHLQENGVTAILNLSLCDENKNPVKSLGAIKPLVAALKSGTPTARENSACALLRLAESDADKSAIGRAGAIPPLVNLLETGGVRGKKDAATALYSLCLTTENKVRAVDAGIVKPLVELMAEIGSSMVEKAAFVLRGLIAIPEARLELVKESGIPVLVEIVEVGNRRQKEIAVSILLQLCEESHIFCNIVGREGAIPPLISLSHTSTGTTKKKAEALIELLRQPKSINGLGVVGVSQCVSE